MNPDKQRAFDFADAIIAGKPKDIRYLQDWKKQTFKQFKQSDPNMTWKDFLARLKRIEHFHRIVSHEVEV